MGGRRFLAGAMMLTVAAGTAWAGGRPDHERARDLVEAGRVLPLSVILEQLEPRFPGRVLEVELEEERGGRVVYELDILGADGEALEVEVDAASGEVLEVEHGD